MKNIFVFGSNLAGRHGAGAAFYANRLHGAQYGVGVGITGRSYAIPTKDQELKVLSLPTIEGHVKDFLAYARSHPTLTFEITPIGTGLAGYSHKQIAPMFKGAPNNCIIPEVWKEFV